MNKSHQHKILTTLELRESTILLLSVTDYFVTGKGSSSKMPTKSTNIHTWYESSKREICEREKKQKTKKKTDPKLWFPLYNLVNLFQLVVNHLVNLL